MMTLRAVCVSLLLIAVLPSQGRSSEIRRLSLTEALRAGGFILPVEWAGVWAFDDTTRQCGSMTDLNVDSGLDTLCAGVSIEPDTTGGAQYTCSGTISTTEVDVVCTFSVSFESCTITYETTTRASRSGDTATSYFRFRSTSTPPLCAFFPDSCEEEFGRLTRIAPAPPSCTTAVQEATWGRVKNWYR